VPKPKPHADGLLRVAADLGVPPERCVYVGDAPSDGAAAVAAGYGGVVGVSYGSHAESVLVDTGHFDVICPTVGALEAALFPKGAGDDAEALAGALRARAPA
jgi:phosphoglycolate phosphatase